MSSARWTMALAALVALAPPVGASSMSAPFPFRPKEFAFICDGQRFHLFYTRENLFLPADSTTRDIGHATSVDLVHWDQLPPVLKVQPDSWDNWHVWSPCVVKSGDTWCMFYTGVTNRPGSYRLFQRIGLATSPDLMNWTPLDEPVYGCEQVPWTYCDSTVASGGDFRDCWVMPDTSASGGWLMIYVARPDSWRDQMVAAIAHSGADLTEWNDLGAMWNTDWFHSFSPLIESPTLFERDSLWYLFYTTNSGHPINFETGPGPLGDSTSWNNQRHLSSEVTEPTDYWFGPEFLRVGPHDYFAAVNSATYTIEIREMVWGTPPHFTFAEPSIEGLGVGDASPAAGLGLRLAGRSGAGSWRFAITSDAPAHVALDLLDTAGRSLARLAERDLGAGTTEVGWDGCDRAGRAVRSGVYFARLVSGSRVRVVRFAVVR